MRSPIELARQRGEQRLRMAGVAFLLALGARLVVGAPSPRPPMRVTDSGLPAALAQATLAAPVALHLETSRVPGAAERDWLRALARAGSPVTWNAPDSLPSLALQLEPIVAPGGRYSATVLGTTGAPVALHDRVGLVDSLRLGQNGALSMQAAIDDRLQADLPNGSASVGTFDTAVVRPVLVAGHAGWEGKYVVAALEEAGWRVISRLAVAPDVYVGEARLPALDTARFAAAVLLDSLAYRLPEVVRYLRSGGGVVLGSESAARAGLAALAGVSPAGRLHGEVGALSSATPRAGLSGIALRVNDQRTTVLERRGASAVTVAHRVGSGRILAVGLDDTWRWRMQGEDGSVEAHRAWWSSAVAHVAYAPLPNTALVAGLDAAPKVALHVALGPAASAPALSSRFPSAVLDATLLGLAFMALLGEWASRRLRGAR